MIARTAARLALLVALGLAPASVAAQDAKKSAPTNPVGAGTWAPTVNKDAPAGAEELDKKQLELVAKVSAYFNQMPNLRGTFTQTSADNKRVRGKFYVMRPGKFRFDYSAPSKLVIISDGDRLRIQDYDLNNESVYRLDETPFRVLMRKDVDLLRDAKILEVQEVNDVIIVGLQDKSPDAPGQIKILLSKKPTLELKEWVTTDAQGLDTRVELTEMAKADDLDPNLFNPVSVTFKKLQQ